MISIQVHGSLSKTESFLKRMTKLNIDSKLHAHGREGVAALSAATPVESGVAASSWGYEINHSRSGVAITWTNSNTESGFPVVIMLQYGHGTGTGGYVQGRDFINPAIKPVFEKIADAVWKEVKSA